MRLSELHPQRWGHRGGRGGGASGEEPEEHDAHHGHAHGPTELLEGGEHSGGRAGVARWHARQDDVEQRCHHRAHAQTGDQEAGDEVPAGQPGASRSAG